MLKIILTLFLTSSWLIGHKALATKVEPLTGEELKWLLTLTDHGFFEFNEGLLPECPELRRRYHFRAEQILATTRSLSREQGSHVQQMTDSLNQVHQRAERAYRNLRNVCVNLPTVYQRESLRRISATHLSLLHEQIRQALYWLKTKWRSTTLRSFDKNDRDLWCDLFKASGQWWKVARLAVATGFHKKAGFQLALQQVTHEYFASHGQQTESQVFNFLSSEPQASTNLPVRAPSVLPSRSILNLLSEPQYQRRSFRALRSMVRSEVTTPARQSSARRELAPFTHIDQIVAFVKQDLAPNDPVLQRQLLLRALRDRSWVRDGFYYDDGQNAWGTIAVVLAEIPPWEIEPGTGVHHLFHLLFSPEYLQDFAVAIEWDIDQFNKEEDFYKRLASHLLWLFTEKGTDTSDQLAHSFKMLTTLYTSPTWIRRVPNLETETLRILRQILAKDAYLWPNRLRSFVIDRSHASALPERSQRYEALYLILEDQHGVEVQLPRPKRSAFCAMFGIESETGKNNLLQKR